MSAANAIELTLLQKGEEFLKWVFYWAVYYTFFVRNKPSPVVRVPATDIVVETVADGTQTLSVKNIKKKLWISDVAGSKSMDPWFDQGDRVLLQESDGKDVQVGDVVVYAKNGDNSDLIIHQVVATDQDAGGEYLVTRGLNNYIPDRIHVRRSWVRHVMLGVIY